MVQQAWRAVAMQIHTDIETAKSLTPLAPSQRSRVPSRIFLRQSHSMVSGPNHDRLASSVWLRADPPLIT